MRFATGDGNHEELTLLLVLHASAKRVVLL